MNVQSLTSAFAALAIAASLLPCSNAATLSGDQEPMLDFEVTGSAEADTTLGPVIQSTTAAGVELTGTISTPNPCYEVSAELSGSGRKLELVLTARSRGGICPQMIANFTYRAWITGLEAGAYQLTTRYSYPQTGWEEQRFSLQLEVPEVNQ